MPEQTNIAEYSKTEAELSRLRNIVATTPMSDKPMLYKPVGSDENIITDESILHVIHDKQDCLECISDYGYDDLLPLTAAEWWNFAPWQSVETIQIDTPILIMVKGVVQDAIYAVNAKEEVYLWFNEEVLAYTTEIDKWLPLP